DALEEPDMRDRRSEVDVTHPLTADLLPRHLDAAALADDALVADALVLAAVALPVLGRTEDALAEEAVALGLERAVVDRLGLRYLAGRPVANLLGRRQPNADGVELIDVDQSSPLLLNLYVGQVVGERSRLGLGLFLCVLCGAHLDVGEVAQLLVGRQRQLLARLVHALLAFLGLLGGRLPSRRPQRARREVDAELLGGAEQLVVLLAYLDLLALVREDVDVERERLHLLQQHLERLGDRRLGDVLALDDRLVGLDAPDRVVGLDREHLLQRVGRAVRLERPDLHLAEALAAELCLTPERLLGDQRVGAGRARVDLVVHQVEQLQDVHVADRHLLLEGVAVPAVEQPHLAGAVPTLGPLRVDQELDRRVRVQLRPLDERLVDVLLARAVEDRRSDRARVAVRRVAVLVEDAVRRGPAEVRLEDLADVHPARHTERVEHDVDRAAVLEERHVLVRHDLRDHALVAVAAGELVAL